MPRRLPEVRCVCGWLLARWDGRGRLEIKCPRCGKIMRHGVPRPRGDEPPGQGEDGRVSLRRRYLRFYDAGDRSVMVITEVDWRQGFQRVAAQPT